MRYSDTIRRAAIKGVADLEKIQADYQHKADELQPYIDRLHKILDDEPID